MDPREEKKKRERLHLEQFCRVSGVLSSSILIDSDRPDFLTKHGDRTLGIEHGRFSFFLDAAKRRAGEVERARVVARAREIAEEKGVPPLVVWFLFEADFRSSKRECESTAQAVAKAVASNVPLVGGRVDFERAFPRHPVLPAALAHLHIARIAGRRSHDWSAPEAGMCPVEFREALQAMVSAKSARLGDYRRTCDACWLLLVAEGDAPSSYAEAGDETRLARYLFEFERTFFMEAFSGNWFELGRA